jgi:hypothetical protein
MVGNRAKGICGSLNGTQSEGWNGGTKGGRTRMIVMAVTSGMYGSLL